jgi:hypothetical protein
MVKTNWNIQGLVAEPGLRLDTRFESIDQDQPRPDRRESASGKAEPEESGGRFVHVSPGFSYAFAKSTRFTGSSRCPFTSP